MFLAGKPDILVVLTGWKWNRAAADSHLHEDELRPDEVD